MNKGVMGNPLAVSILLSSLDECPGPLRGLKLLFGTLHTIKVERVAPSVGRGVLAVHVTISLRTVLCKLGR